MLKKPHAAYYALGAFFSSHALANKGLPKAKDSSAASDGDYIAMTRETAGDGITLGAQLVGAALLITVAAILIKTLWGISQDKKEWSDLGSLGAGSGVVSVIGIILLTMAEDIFK